MGTGCVITKPCLVVTWCSSRYSKQLDFKDVFMEAVEIGKGVPVLVPHGVQR